MALRLQQLEQLQVSIHAPREGCDAFAAVLHQLRGGFQSTHPVRGATQKSFEPKKPAWGFNPRTP